MALLGDLFNFPSEAAVEWFMDVMNNSGVPFYYTAGNHDWHYEGMPGSSKDLRRTWTEKRLLPLFRGNNPLCYAQEIKGVRFLMIDNSIYEILPEQLEFLENEIKTGKPLVLMMHIPLYVEGRRNDYGCGSPYWGAAIDDSFELERRERWPESGHTEVTMKFHELATSTPEILGVFAGHFHSRAINIINGTPQFVIGSNARACYMDLQIIPADK